MESYFEKSDNVSDFKDLKGRLGGAAEDANSLDGMSKRDIRALAFHFIYAMEQFDYTVSLESIVDNFRRGFELDIPEDSPAINIARSVIEERDQLDIKYKPFLKNWSLERLGCCTKLILRIAVWELDQKDAIPNVVINEAIELAKGFAEKDAYKFVNGILDELKNVNQDEQKDEQAPNS